MEGTAGVLRMGGKVASIRYERAVGGREDDGNDCEYDKTMNTVIKFG